MKLKMHKIRIVVFFIALTIGYPTPGLSAAKVSKQPASIRQTYPDGTFTELACFGSTCSFTVSERRLKQTYKFARVQFGYRVSIDTYRYFEGQKLYVPYFTVPVACGDADVLLLPDIDLNTVECDLELQLVKGRAVANRLLISGMAGEKYVSHSKELDEN